MGNANKIISIDISSKKVKVALVSEKLEIDALSIQGYDVIDEDVDGFAKHFDMDQIWNKVKSGIKNVIQQGKPENIVGISSCGQRMGTVFLDKQGNEIYGGPNTDIRGIDSAYLIEDEFSDEELFNITAHSPSLMFSLARLLWYQEEEEEIYHGIGKVLMLDDWIVFKLTGEYYTDYTSICESQLFDIKNKIWSSKIIEAFDIDTDILPEIISTGTIAGNVKTELIGQFGLPNKEVPVIKGCGDTQANLLGMGAIELGNIGISLGTTAPVHLIIDKPIIDSNLNFWTECHIIKDKWLIEANTGGTGRAYDWFKDAFISASEENPDKIMNEYLSRGKPGSNSTFAFIGPELMAVKDQTSIKRGVFVFSPPSMVGEELPKLENFARSAIEDICFGILENFQALKPFTQTKIELFCSGGMSKSKEFCSILANILNKEIKVPKVRDSAFIGNAMNVLIGLNLYSDYKKIIDELMNFDVVPFDSSISEEYKGIYSQWKNLKNKIDDL